MKWLLITTIGKNPGDEWIRIGIQKMIDKTDPDREYILLDKEEPSIYTTPVEFDKCIWCGMPVFWSLGQEQNCRIFWWKDLMLGWPSERKNDFMVLGAGSFFPWGSELESITYREQLIKSAEDVLKRSYYVTARDSVVSMVTSKPIPHMICPAIFSIIGHRKSHELRLASIMPRGGHYSVFGPREAEAWDFKKYEISRILQDNGFIYIAHSKKEAEFARGCGWRTVISYNGDLYILLAHYGRCGKFFGNRVHGAIVARGNDADVWSVGYDSRQEAVRLSGAKVSKPSELDIEQIADWASRDIKAEPFDMESDFEKQVDIVRSFMLATQTSDAAPQYSEELIKSSPKKGCSDITFVSPKQSEMVDFCQDKISRVLFIRPDSIGDNVLAASMLPHIRKKFEHARITVLCQEHIAELYEACPYVDNIVVFNRKKAYEDAGYRNGIINRLRALKPDLSLNSVFSREPLTDVFAIESGAGSRVAFEGNLTNISAELRHKNNQFYTMLLPDDGKHKLELERHRDFLHGLDINVPSLEPMVWTTTDDENFAEEFFKKNGLKLEDTIALFPAAQHFEKVYPFYHQILGSFNEFNFVILGGSNAKLLAKEICENLPGKCHDLTGKTSIRQMASILRCCRLYIGADSAGAHIACAVGIPNIVVLGGGHFGRFMPYSPLTSIVCLPLECFGCDWKCGYQRPHCVKDIAPEVFTEAVWQTFQKPSERIRIFVQSASLWNPEPGQPKWRMFERSPAVGDVEIITVDKGIAVAPPQTRLHGRETTDTLTQLKKNAAADAPQERKYLVSVIVSTYNSEKFIRGCLEDLEKQTIADRLEIIVVNSGSQQNEEAIVKEFQRKYDNIKYIRTDQRETIYRAWNRAIEAAAGEYITNANTDDRHREDALEVMADTLLANPDIALVYADQIRTNTPDDSFANHHGVEMLPRPDYSRQRLLFGCCVGSQPMWRKSLHKEFGCFDETLTCAGDWDFWLRISDKYQFKHIPGFLGLYYYNKDGVEHSRKIHSLYERYIVGKRYGTPYISVIPLYQSRDNPLVSVIMPAYNASEHIAEAIESVLIQNYRNFEIIVIDDGSTDNTSEIVAGFDDDKIKYFYKNNTGVAGARNLGIEKAKGIFIINLDADDMIMPGFIARHLQEFNKHPEADIIYCDDCLIDENDRPLRVIERPQYPDRKFLIRDLFRCGFPVVPFRTCIRKSVFDKIGLFDEKLLVAEDYDMIRRFVKCGLTAHHLKGVLYLRRMTPDSLSSSSTIDKAESHFNVFRRFTDTFSYDELFPDVAWDRIPPDRRMPCAKCLSAVTCLAIGRAYVKSNSPACAKTAFDLAYSDLMDCLKMDPANRLVRQLLQKSELVRAGCGTVRQIAR